MPAVEKKYFLLISCNKRVNDLFNNQDPGFHARLYCIKSPLALKNIAELH